jgi:hypothetical protein
MARHTSPSVGSGSGCLLMLDSWITTFWVSWSYCSEGMRSRRPSSSPESSSSSSRVRSGSLQFVSRECASGALRWSIRCGLLLVVVRVISKQVVVISQVGSFIIYLCVDQVAERSLSGNDVVFVFAQLVWYGLIGGQNSAGDCAWEIWRCLVAGVCGDLVGHFGVLWRRGCGDELKPKRQDWCSEADGLGE